MFATPAYAQGAADAGAGPSGFTAILLNIAPLLFIFVIFYVVMIRPQQKRMKQHQAMLAAVKRNDVVVTSGGLIGKVIKVDDAEVEVELAPNVRVRVIRGMISDVRQPGAKPAND